MFTAAQSSRFSNTDAPDTPYRDARQLWDRRMGSAHQQARNWRMMAFGGLFLSGALAAATIALALRPAAIPFVIEAGPSGEARLIGPASRAYEPTDAQLSWHLARFVELIRSLPSDPVVVRQNWLSAYDWATQGGAQALTAMAEADDPFAQVGKTTVAVEILSVVRASPASFNLRWRESAYSNGTLTNVDRYTGVATIVIDPPSTPDRLQKNPLGLYVHAFTWSRDLQQ